MSKTLRSNNPNTTLGTEAKKGKQGLPTAALLRAAKRWEQLRCPVDERINTMWYRHTIKYYSVIKRKFWYTLLCMNHEGSVPSEARNKRTNTI